MSSFVELSIIDVALALSLVLVAVSLSVLVGLRGHWLGGNR